MFCCRCNPFFVWYIARTFLLFAYNCRFIATLGSYTLSWGSIDFLLSFSLASRTSLFPQLLFFRLFFTPSNDRFFFGCTFVQSAEWDAISILLDIAGWISSSTNLLASKISKSIIQLVEKEKEKKMHGNCWQMPWSAKAYSLTITLAPLPIGCNTQDVLCPHRINLLVLMRSSIAYDVAGLTLL